MWHEARRREKATQKLLHEHKKRADRRREENKIDPNSLLQIHGFKSKLCLEPGVYKQAVRSLVAWQGDKSITIDRFDVRATLSSIPSAKSTSRDNTVLDSEESIFMKKLINYERYRLLIQNDLNKVPEELRLKLVAKSDMASDAKMKKLRNNRFGTSGETSISYGQAHNNAAAVIFNRHMQVRDQPSKRGATMGYNYNSVPPPASLSEGSKYDDNTKSQDNDNDSSRDQALRISDEIDNFELDGIMISNFEAKKLNDIAKKYGLSGEELVLLARKDREDLNSAQLLKEIIKLNKSKDKAEKELKSSANDQVYGPALPPKLMSNDLSSSSEDDDDDNSPVRQRSPSGANIPLRNGSNRDPSESDNDFEITEVSDTKGVSKSNRSSPEKPMKLNSPSPSPSLSLSLSPSHSPSPPEQSTSCAHSDTATKFKHLIEKSKDIEEPILGEQKQSPAHMSPRRAPTPLAYKRNCRSSRSLSRERRSNRHQSNNHKSSRRSRHRSRSRSSSSPSQAANSTTSSSKSSLNSHSIRRTSSSDCPSESSIRPSKRRRRRRRSSRSRKKRKGDGSQKFERKSKYRNHKRRS